MKRDRKKPTYLWEGNVFCLETLLPWYFNTLNPKMEVDGSDDFPIQSGSFLG